MTFPGDVLIVPVDANWNNVSQAVATSMTVQKCPIFRDIEIVAGIIQPDNVSGSSFLAFGIYDLAGILMQPFNKVNTSSGQGIGARSVPITPSFMLRAGIWLFALGSVGATIGVHGSNTIGLSQQCARLCLKSSNVVGAGGVCPPTLGQLSNTNASLPNLIFIGK